MKRKLYLVFFFLFASPVCASDFYSYNNIMDRLNHVIAELNSGDCNGLKANACITDRDTQRVLEYLAVDSNASPYLEHIRTLSNVYRQRRGNLKTHDLIANLVSATLRIRSAQTQSFSTQYAYPHIPQPSYEFPITATTPTLTLHNAIAQPQVTPCRMMLLACLGLYLLSFTF